MKSAATTDNRAYSIRVISPMRHLSVFLAFIVSLMAFRLYAFDRYPMIEWYYYSLTEMQALLLIGAYMLSGYFLGWRFGCAKIQLSISKSGLQWHWQRRYPWSNAEDFDLAWKDVAHYDFPYDRYYYPLQLRLLSSKKIKFYALRKTKNNDFLAFKEDFVNEIERWNEHAVVENHAVISKPPSFYESKTAYVLIYVIIAFLILFTLGFVFFLEEYMPPLILFIVMGGASYMYIGHVLDTRSKMRKRQGITRSE